MVDEFTLANKTSYPGDIGAGILMDLVRFPRDEDTRPWLRLIDGDGVWRANTLTIARSLFLVHAPGNDCSTAGDEAAKVACAAAGATPGPDYVEWETTLGPGTYDLQTSWLYSVTQRLDDPLVIDLSEDPALDGAALADRMRWQNTFGFKIDFKNDNAHLRPSPTATYTLLGADGGTVSFTVDQRLFNVDAYDA